MEILEEQETRTFLSVAEILGKRNAFFYMDGVLLCKEIDNALSKGMEVVLSFKNMESVSFPFLNSVLGLNFYKHPKETIYKLLKFSALTPELEMDIDEVYWRSKNAEAHLELIEAVDSDIYSNVKNIPKMIPASIYDHPSFQVSPK